MSKRRRNRNVNVVVNEEVPELLNDIDEEEEESEDDVKVEPETKEGVGSMIGDLWQKIKKPVLIGAGVAAAIAGAFALGRITSGDDDEIEDLDDDVSFDRPTVTMTTDDPNMISRISESLESTADRFAIPDVTDTVTSV